MRKASKATVKVDLTPIKKGVVECNACIDFNSMEQPELHIDLSGKQHNALAHRIEPLEPCRGAHPATGPGVSHVQSVR